jgi:hypothetical protein
MNPIEIFILYLACGAPFGVYFYFQNRNSRAAVLKAFLTVVVWIPYALRLLNANVTKKISVSKFDALEESDSALRQKLDELQKRLTRILPESRTGVSVFEFREVVERYAGLTLARQTDEPGANESELFKITNHQNTPLGTKCLHRRNRLRLEFHQRLASRDFLKLLSKLSVFEAEKLRANALEFVTLLNDGETRRAVENLFAESSQIARDFVVIQGEKAVWNSKEHKPPRVKPISVPLTSRAMTATTNLRKPD